MSERSHLSLTHLSDRLPFAQVRELARAGVTIVSGVGNSGPGWGTLLNPADDALVIGVSGMRPSGRLAAYASRGPTLWELPHGASRMGVDVVTHGEFWAARPSGGCQLQWGTSVACPVVVGVLALLLSSLTPTQRAALRSPAALKQALHQSSSRMPGRSHLEQGGGELRPHALHEAMLRFAPHLSALPPSLDLLDCPYMAPHCDANLYAGASPLAFNLTLLDSYAASGTLARAPSWHESSATSSEGAGAAPSPILDVSFAMSGRFDGGVSFLGVAIAVRPGAAAWEGVVSGEIRVDLVAGGEAPPPSGLGRAGGGGVEAMPVDGETPAEKDGADGADGTTPRTMLAPVAGRSVLVPVRVRVVATPPRRRRLLLDLYHSSAYPNGFFPTDDLERHATELMDTRGDHPHTNFRRLATALRHAGFHVELLTSDARSFDASSYAALLLLDPEEGWMAGEAAKLVEDVTSRGLGLIVAADWHDPLIMQRLFYRDELAALDHHCGSGGANVPALNALLAPLGLGLRSHAFAGSFSVDGRRVRYRSGSALAMAPAGTLVLSASLRRVPAAAILPVAGSEEAAAAETAAKAAAEAVAEAVAEEELAAQRQASAALRARGGDEQELGVWPPLASGAAVERVPFLAYHVPTPAASASASASSSASASGGFVLLLGDSSCLEDDDEEEATRPADARPDARPDSAHQDAPGNCRFLLSEILTAALRPADKASSAGHAAAVLESAGRPAVLRRAERLRQAYRSREDTPEMGPLSAATTATTATVSSSAEGAEVAEDAQQRRQLSVAQLEAFHSSSRVWALRSGCRASSASCTLPLVPPPVWRRAGMGVTLSPGGSVLAWWAITWPGWASLLAMGVCAMAARARRRGMARARRRASGETRTL